MDDYLAAFETKFSKLAGMQPPVAEEMQVASLLLTMTHEEWSSGTIAALKTME